MPDNKDTKPAPPVRRPVPESGLVVTNSQKPTTSETVNVAPPPKRK